MFILVSFVFFVSALTVYEERIQLENDLVSSGYGWLVDYSGQDLYSSIEVYAEGFGERVAVFENVSEESWYRVLLDNLSEAGDVFYLKSLGGVEYDYIVDPSACTGTATSCSSLGEYSCDDQSGCSWTSSSCSGSATSCSGYESSAGCSGQYGCSWTSSSCSGSATWCTEYGTSGSCAVQAGCSWTGNCNDFDQDKPDCDFNSGCSWVGCGGTASCSAISDEYQCEYMESYGCSLICSGGNYSCSEFTQSNCYGVPGCTLNFASMQCEGNGSSCSSLTGDPSHCLFSSSCSNICTGSISINCGDLGSSQSYCENGGPSGLPIGCVWEGCSGTYCDGNPTSCSTYNNNQGSCTTQGGCSWNPAACSGSATSCSTYNNNQGSCTTQGGCSWNPAACSGSATSCSTYDSDSGGCDSQGGCSFNSAGCSGSATSCSSIYNQGDCSAQSGCSWRDSNAPTYTWFGHNNTIKGQSTKFSLYVNDGTALHSNGYYIFSTNNSGSWANDSQVAFSATPSWANVTKTLSPTFDGVGYRWYLRDNAGNWAVTPIYLVSGYQISNCDGLQAVNNNLEGNYILMNNINCSGTVSWNGGQGFVPLGNSSTGFSGNFNGNRYNITGLYINRAWANEQGLFGVISPSGVVSDVGLTMNVSGGTRTGGFVGHNYGTILRSYSIGSVYSNEDQDVGGFVGRNAGSINDSYSQASVSGFGFAGGGFAGANEIGTIANSYSTGAVSGEFYIGGFLGWLISGSVSNSFWDTQTSGRATSEGGTGRTTAQMKTLATFTGAGWSIAEVGSYDGEVWFINSEVDYPRLGTGQQVVQDTTPPTYSSAGHNSTLAGNSTLFSITWNDETALNPKGQYIFSTNNTGSWVNASAVNFTATPSSANVARTLNSSVGVSIGYRWYARDDAGNWNATPVYSLVTTSSLTPDTTPPTYSSAGHNSTLAGNSTRFYVLWNDNTALNSRGQYIFSTNNTGSWANDSAVNFTATPSWANVTKALSSSVGVSIGYRWYARDDTGNWNATPVYSLVTTTDGEEVSGIVLQFVPPTPPNGATTQNTLIPVNVSISGGNLSEVKWNWDGTNYSFYNDSLVLFMNLNNLSSLGENNSFVRDLSGYGNNGVPSGATPTTGKYSGGYSFTRGSSHYINLGSATNNIDSNVYSISAWVKKDTAQTGDWQSIVSRGTNGHFLTGRTSGYVTFGQQSVGGAQLGSVGTPLANSDWHHLVGTYDGAVLRLYIDGVFDNSRSIVHTYDHSKELRIGGDVNHGEYFGGVIDEVMIFDRALSASEVSHLYMSNLQKYNATQWYLYVNQGKNATAGLDEGTYSYYASAKISSGSENKTETRTITLTEPAEVIYWICTGSTVRNWANSSCWSLNRVPSQGDAVIINGSGIGVINISNNTLTQNLNSFTIEPSYSGANAKIYFYPLFAKGDWTGRNDGTQEWNVTGNINIGGGTLYVHGDYRHASFTGVAGNVTAEGHGQIWKSVNGNIIIADTAKLDGAGLGFPAATGPGAPTEQSRGGAHGGRGGGNSLNPYGNATAPTSLGSGGVNRAGGSGIKLQGGHIIIDGEINMDGVSSQNTGAGGSIWIKAESISGTGSIKASGGNTEIGYGTGGGGRIFFEYGNNLDFVGGVAVSSLTTGTNPGRGGTLVFTNNTWPGDWNLTGSIGLLGGDFGYGDAINVLGDLNTNGHDITIYGDCFYSTANPLTCWNKTLDGRGVWINASGDINISSGTQIYGTGLGFPNTVGPGAGGGTNYGGTYGGRGGVTNRNTYGNEAEPISLGSGGNAGFGGSAVRLQSPGKVVIDGKILVEGTGGYGGGSGGSVFVRANNITGSGAITASGSGAGSTAYTYGGGGGRVGLIANSDLSFFGEIINTGGVTSNVGRSGSGGTIYINSGDILDLGNFSVVGYNGTSGTPDRGQRINITGYDIVLSDVYNASQIGVANTIDGEIYVNYCSLIDDGATYDPDAVKTLRDDCIDPSLNFISIWNTSKTFGGSSGSNQVKLPLYNGGNYDFEIDWGDGNQDLITSWNQAETTHTYSSAGVYNVTISGTIKGFRFNNGGDRLKILDILQWGSLNLGNEGGYFYGCENLNATATDSLDLTGTTTLNSAFSGAYNFNGDIGSWDTSSVEDMGYMFQGATSFNQNIGSWDTSSVEDMRSMFQEATSFNQNIGNWNTAKVTSMNSMFYSATSFNQNIGNWNVSSVTDMLATFYLATSFNQNIGNWNTAKVTSMNSMFYSATSFNQNIGNWNVSSVTDMGFMFSGVTLSTANYDSLLVGWAGLPSLKNGVTFGGGNSRYCQGRFARNNTLIGVYGWSVSDGGVDAGCDITPPVISVHSPVNTTYYTGTIYFNATANEAVSAWVVNWNGTNVTLGAINTSLSVEDGTHRLYFYANDTNGNWGVNDSIWFSVDTTPPSVSIAKTYPLSDEVNVTKDAFFRVELNVSCLSGNCGTINVSLDPFESGWGYRTNLSVGSSYFDNSLNDFPVKVVLNSSNFDFAKARSDGYDIRFTSSDGSTILEYAREKHDSVSGEAVYWVKVPSVSSSTGALICLYYGNSGASDGENGANVWGGGAKGVYLMEGTGTTSYNKVGEGNITGIRNGSGLINASGTYQSWYGSLGGGYTFVIKHSGITLGQWEGFFHLGGTGNDRIDWQRNSLDNYIRVQHGSNDYSMRSLNINYLANPGVFAGVWTTSQSYAYINDSLTAQVGVANLPAIPSGTLHLSGGFSTYDYLFVWNESRSADFVKAFYNSVEGRLLSFGVEEGRAIKSGLIPVNSGTPFYTNASSNPLTTSALTAGQSEIVTFWVNATGEEDTTHTFFAFANLTSDLSVSNKTDDWNVTISANIPPNNPVVLINSTDGTNRTAQNLNCYATISDPDGDVMNVSVRWYKNNLLNLTTDYNNNYVNGTNFAAPLGHGNTTKGDDWKCSMRLYDGQEYSGWENSSSLTIVNTLPVVTLISPPNWGATTNRSIGFSWSGSDDDNDALTYDFNITDYKFSGDDTCTDFRSIEGSSSTSYLPLYPWRCLHDNGYYYKWKVRAHDGAGYGDWSPEFVVNVTASISISMVQNSMSFSSLTNLNPLNDTTDDTPAPFIIENQGNAVVNVSVNSSALWSTQPTDSPHYQFKVDNVSGEEFAFSWIDSITNWFNFPMSGNVVAIAKFVPFDHRNSAEIDVRLELPPNEPPGPKSSVIIFKADLSETMEDWIQ